MINLIDAMRGTGWAVVLAPFWLFFVYLFAREARKARYCSETGGRGLPRAFALKIGCCMTLLAFVLSLIPWYKCLMTLGFDWDSSDAAEVEILVFDEPIPLEHAVRTVSVTDRGTIRQIVDHLQHLEPPLMRSKDHPVGRTYVLRLRRASDGEWSGYRVALSPDALFAGESDVHRIYGVSILRSSRSSIGVFRAPAFGAAVLQLVGGAEQVDRDRIEPAGSEGEGRREGEEEAGHH